MHTDLRIIYVSLLLAAVSIYSNAFAREEAFSHAAEMSIESYSITTGNLELVQVEQAFKAEQVYTQSKFYDDIVHSFQKTLKAQGIDTRISADSNESDYRIVFVDIPYHYGQVWAGKRMLAAHLSSASSPYPANLKNKHDSESVAKQTFISPWMRATFYYDEKHQLIGGNLMILNAHYLRIRELFYAAHGQWQNILLQPTETINQVSVEYKAYENALIAYDELFKERMERKKFTRPSDQELQDAFLISHNNQALDTARLANISIRAEWSSPEVALTDCINRSLPAYRTLYLSLLSKAVEGPREDRKKDNELFIISALKKSRLAKVDNNCFLKPMFLGEQK